MGDAIVVFVLKWGRIIIGYGLLVAGVSLLVAAIANLVGVQLHTPDYYVLMFSDYLGNAADAILDTVQADGEEGFGPIMLWAMGFDGLVAGTVLILDFVAVGLTFLASIASGVLGCLALRYLIDKGIIKANMFSGTKVGM